MTEPERTRRPLEQVVDVVVYAPIGLFFEAPSLLPKLVARGKSQVRNARSVGKLVVEHGQGRVRRRLGALPEPIGGLARLFDGTGGPADAPGGTTASSAAAEPATRPTGAGPSKAADQLAIPGYDSLSASQVVGRLAGLTDDELEAVRAYEAAHRGRRTILNKIAQLQAR